MKFQHNKNDIVEYITTCKADQKHASAPVNFVNLSTQVLYHPRFMGNKTSEKEHSWGRTEPELSSWWAPHTGTHSSRGTGRLWPAAKSGPPHVSVNKVLLEHSRARSLHSLRLPTHYNSSKHVTQAVWLTEPKAFTLCPPQAELQGTNSVWQVICVPSASPSACRTAPHNRGSVHLFSR